MSVAFRPRDGVVSFLSPAGPRPPGCQAPLLWAWGCVCPNMVENQNTNNQELLGRPPLSARGAGEAAREVASGAVAGLRGPLLKPPNFLHSRPSLVGFVLGVLVPLLCSSLQKAPCL